MRVIDLFCGAGGFSEGFRQVGFDVIWAVDNWQPAVLTHQRNHPEGVTHLGDVEKIAYLPDKEFNELVQDSEIIIGSPPCVDFSNSNRSGKADKSHGIQLIKSFLRIVARKKYKKNSVLKYWILENVANAKIHVKDSYTAQDLDLEGNFELKVLFGSSHIYKAQYFGVPSKRVRFLCGEFPEPKKLIEHEEEFIPLKTVTGKLGYPKGDAKKTITDPNYSFQIDANELTDHYYIQQLATFEWKKAKRLKQDKGYMGKMAFPENEDSPARTIMATMSFSARESMIFRYGKNTYRAPTIREIASLMSFPVDYRFYGNSIGLKYKLVGNAVPPKMSYAFAKAIAEKENLELPQNYKPRKFPENDVEFYNLNEKNIPVKKEMPKNNKAKFKYHIPQLKENTLRVELTNRHSNFEKENFIWQVEIHKSQGPKADYFSPTANPRWMPQEYVQQIKLFIDEYSKKVPEPKIFQEYHCQTDAHRKSNKLIGPMELLINTRSFIDSLHLNGRKGVTITSSKKKIELPISIAIGYFVLSKILEHARR
ncbi:MAG: DNA cytosine methyltransferase [Anaerolineales bacterium]|nr:DNA cytosine methyltransferase [Anaerolineales bacterium]